MKLFPNLRTGTKLFYGVGFILVLLVAVIVTAYTSITGIQDSQRTIFEQDFANAADLQMLGFNDNSVRVAMLTMILVTDRAKQDVLANEVRAIVTDQTQISERLVARYEKSPAALRRMEEWQTIRDAYRQTRETEVFPAIFGGKVEEAKALSLGIQTERFESMRRITQQLRTEAMNKSKKAVEDSEARASRSVQIFLAVGGAAMLVGILVFALLTKMAGNLRGIAQEIDEAVNVLAASASEIVASTTQLAAGAAETATAVTETTTTVEEVKQTSQLSSEKARYVSDQSKRASEVAQSGKRAVDETIGGMNGIRQQMGAVAESILSLSAQSQAIGEIIATVDDLAAQSKLLAVNASIEAAKAGDEGKGFTVVAQEVRSLAEQSKQATTQVRAILSDIQKATSGAVLATEQGSKAVETGVRQSNAAGESIGALTDSIAEAAQASTQIAATSKQQFVGMDQVAMAMENIKTASTQTVASTRQVETAAQQLHDLGQKLKRLVDRFKV